MSISISSALSTLATNTSPNAIQTTQSPESQQPASNAGYTIQLSEAQQVYQLYNQGQQVEQIAATLNLSVAAVNNYLGITNSNT
jgi:DNA-binding NarL/FixJ family response regulator